MPEDTRMTQGMASQLETLGGLERRLTLTISPEEIESQVNERLRSLARSVRMPGFRPGKVPLKMVAKSYGPQVQAEILNSGGDDTACIVFWDITDWIEAQRLFQQVLEAPVHKDYAAEDRFFKAQARVRLQALPLRR